MEILQPSSILISNIFKISDKTKPLLIYSSPLGIKIRLNWGRVSFVVVFCVFLEMRSNIKLLLLLFLKIRVSTYVYVFPLSWTYSHA